MADVSNTTRATDFPKSRLIPAWRVRTDFEYNGAELRKLSLARQNEMWATQLLHDLVHALDVEPVCRVTLNENGIEDVDVVALIPFHILERLAQFDADGDPDIEVQCEDQGAACEGEGDQCDDEGVANDNGIADWGGIAEAYVGGAVGKGASYG